MLESINKINRVSRAHLHEHGVEPDAATLAQKIGLPEDKVRQALAVAKEPISLETPIADDGDATLGDFVEDTQGATPIDAAMRSGLRDAVTAQLARLNAREAEVVRMRFGIGTGIDHTLEEIGQQLDMSRERVREIEAQALRKLKKQPEGSQRLRSYADALS